MVLLAVAYAGAVAAAAVGGGGGWAIAATSAGAGLALPPVSAVELFLGFAIATRAPRVAAWAAARRARSKGGGGGGGGGLLGLLAAARTAWAVATGMVEVARDAALYAFVLFGVLAVVERLVAP